MQAIDISQLSLLRCLGQSPFTAPQPTTLHNDVYCLHAGDSAAPKNASYEHGLKGAILNFK